MGITSVVIDLRLVSRPDAVPRARHALDDLAEVASEACLEDARLLVSELVTNSIRHGDLAAGADIELKAEVNGNALRVEVCDPGGGFPLRRRTTESEAGSGWGLYLVGVLAARWGVRSDGSTLVWFEIPLGREAIESSSSV